jgi:Tripartite tricarboxylate transporter family receptor
VSQAFTDDYKGVWLVRRDVYFSRVTGEPPGVGAPAGTPADVIDKLNKEINAGLADAKMRERLADVGGVPMPMTPAGSASSSPTKPRNGGKVIIAANIKAG